MEPTTNRAISNKDIELTTDRATSNKDIEPTTNRATSSIDAEIDMSGLGEANNIIEKEIKVCKSNMLWLLLIFNKSLIPKMALKGIVLSSTSDLDQLPIDRPLNFNKYIGDEFMIDKRGW